MDFWQGFASIADAERLLTQTPKLSTRTLRAAVENTLMDAYTRAELELALPEELALEWASQDEVPANAATKRGLIQ